MEVIEWDVAATLNSEIPPSPLHGNIGVMGWEVPSLQEIHLKHIFLGSLP